MAEPFLGMILPFPYAFAPYNWTFCHGQLLTIAQNNGLFSLLGKAYGGDGISNFAVPELRGRMIVGAGQRANASVYPFAQYGGNETVSLNLAQMPIHSHPATFTGTGGGSGSPVSVTVNVSKNTTGNQSSPDATHAYLGPVESMNGDSLTMWSGTLTNPVNLAGVTVSGGGGGITGGTVAVGTAGGGASVKLLNPYLALNFCIALGGVFPTSQ
ncbi:hypothetical protein SIID45300_00573 [Candidatus Magnetaquicoccaceae bacterium FCR-1]|uniref:Phage tail collar domain-containing protein n=1 Tax=Candidatus Magnetaquiglobus chichijimensis TaxID=3141448 RepID=A0ABQ0C5V7_9PROT